jgi:hypothetical protein
LANLLTFFEQQYVYNRNPETFHDEYNIRNPLLVFIGHTVNASKTQSALSDNDEQSLADVEEVLLFLSRVLQNDDNWVPETIETLLSDNSGLEREDGGDLFADEFVALREAGLSGDDIHQRILANVFQTESDADLSVVNITNAQGEIGLRATTTDQYFGVINIGNDRVFLDRVGEHDAIRVEEDEFADSLFRAINSHESDISVLLGSRKFIEGWDSWRVSTMGLMNFGRGKGPQVIQLFGRGVRLLGKNQTLKRSQELPGDHPEHIRALETLNIFGVRAKYIATFRDYLSDEGIDTEVRETIPIETETKDHFQNEGLLVVRPETEGSFTEHTTITIDSSSDIIPEVDLSPRLSMISSQRGYETADEGQEQTIPDAAVEFLDWDSIYRDLWQFRTNRGYDNQVVEKSQLKKIISEDNYVLRCPEELVSFEQFGDLNRIRDIVLMILRKYVERHYGQAEKRWEQSSLTYQPVDAEIDDEDGVLIDSYSAEVKTSAEELLEELESTKESGLYSGEEDAPNRVHYDRHLYLPLIAEESGSDAEKVSYTPPALNDGEEKFVRAIKEHFEQDGATLLEEWEVYLLRNQSRGRGIGFLAADEGTQRFFPDFILWLQGDDEQHIIFVEPHGLALEGDPLANHRVQFHERIKEYEAELIERTGRDDVSLHSYVISRPDAPELISRARLDEREEFHEYGVYFEDDSVGTILSDVLE